MAVTKNAETQGEVKERLGISLDSPNRLSDMVAVKGSDTKIRVQNGSESVERIQGKEFKAIFRNDGMRRIEQGNLFVEKGGDVINFGSMQHVQFSFRTTEDRLDKPDIVMSPTLLGKLHGELGGAIKSTFKERGAYLNDLIAADRTGSKMKPGEEREETLKRGGFGEGKEPKILVKADKEGKMAEVEVVGKGFSFVKSRDGEWEHPAILIKTENLGKLSNTEPGVVIGLAYRNIPAQVEGVKELLRKMDEVSRKAEIAHLLEDKAFQRVQHLG